MIDIVGNCGVVGCWGIDSLGRKTLNGRLFEPKQNQQEKVICKDGTTSITNGAVAPCLNNGGVNENQTQPYINKTKEPIYYILVTAGVMIVSYFAYKKFKK